MYSFRQPFPAPKAKGTSKKGRKAVETVTDKPSVEVIVEEPIVTEIVESDTISEEE